jgi:hypothetical protein
LSSYLEVSLREALVLGIGLSQENLGLVTTVWKLTHRRRLELLQRIIEANLDPVLSFAHIVSLVPTAYQIYKYRNDYLHDLNLPQGEVWLSIEPERRIGE